MLTYLLDLGLIPAAHFFSTSAGCDTFHSDQIRSVIPDPYQTLATPEYLLYQSAFVAQTLWKYWMRTLESAGLCLCHLPWPDPCISSMGHHLQLQHLADVFVQSDWQLFIHIFIHWWPWLPCKVQTSTSGTVWGSVSCPRTRRHADQGNQTSDHPITGRWLCPWARVSLIS